MDPISYEEHLRRAAEHCGVEREFWDIFGTHHVTSAATQRAILESLGFQCTDAAQIETSLRHRELAEWNCLLPATRVVSESDAVVPVWFSSPAGAAHAAVEIHLEDGTARHYPVELASIPIQQTLHCESGPRDKRELHLPTSLPLGYHEVRASCAGESAVMRLIVAPDRAYQPERLRQGGKTAGLAISLYGVRSSRNWGCGDVTDLRAMSEWAARDVGISFLALNPLHAIHNRRPYNTSPYLPNSIFFRNYLYIDVEQVEDFSNSRRAQQAWALPEVQAEVEALRASENVEYERVAALKLRFLKLSFVQFLREYRKQTPRGLRFREYLKGEGELLLLRFATYCALDETIHARHPDVWIWPDWPAEYQRPDSPATLEFQRRSWRRVLFYCYLQWIIDEQLAGAQQHARASGLEIGLYHDLALATDKYGSDLWAHREFFANGCRVGSPPDDFSPLGQDWGFPPPNAERHWRDGYRLFTESIRRTLRHGGALRIDHVMRFFRLYWIPDGIDATGGAYVRDRADDLIRILALESVRNRVLVIGEDLGTVEPYIRETLNRFGVYSYRVFFFEHNAHGQFRDPGEYPEQALVCTATHDLPTLAGFWTGRDIEARRGAGMLDDHAYSAQWSSRDAEKQKMLNVLHRGGLLPAGYPTDAAQIKELTPELHKGAIGFLARTPSALLAVNQEDLTREPNQQNLPGSTWQYPNWGRKMRFTLEQLTSDPDAVECTSMLHEWVRSTGRN